MKCVSPQGPSERYIKGDSSKTKLCIVIPIAITGNENNGGTYISGVTNNCSKMLNISQVILTTDSRKSRPNFTRHKKCTLEKKTYLYQ